MPGVEGFALEGLLASASPTEGSGGSGLRVWVYGFGLKADRSLSNRSVNGDFNPGSA